MVFVMPLIADPTGRFLQSLKVAVKGKATSNPHVVLFSIVNEGSSAVESADFDGPFEFRFPDSFIRHATFERSGDSRSTSSKQRFRFSPHKVVFPPLQIEANGKVSLTLIVDGAGNDLVVERKPSLLRSLMVLRPSEESFLHMDLDPPRLRHLPSRLAHAAWRHLWVSPLGAQAIGRPPR